MKLNQFIVTYKYAAAMGLVKKPAPDFIQSQLEKVEAYKRKRVELHVSPFYESRSKPGTYAYQFVLDFDGPGSFSEVRSLLTSLISATERKYFFVERSGNGVHLVSKFAFYPIELEEIKFLRQAIKELVEKHFKSLDVAHCVRHLPIRRTPGISKYKDKLVMPVEAKEFLTRSRTELDLLWQKFEIKDRDHLRKILLNYTLPREIVDWSQLDFAEMIYKKAKALKRLLSK